MEARAPAALQMSRERVGHTTELFVRTPFPLASELCKISHGEWQLVCFDGPNRPL